MDQQDIKFRLAGFWSLIFRVTIMDRIRRTINLNPYDYVIKSPGYGLIDLLAGYIESLKTKRKKTILKSNIS